MVWLVRMQGHFRLESIMQMGTSAGKDAPKGYALWAYDGQRWELKKDVSEPDAVPSDPPQLQGSFVGQIRATPSVAAA